MLSISLLILKGVLVVGGIIIGILKINKNLYESIDNWSVKLFV